MCIWVGWLGGWFLCCTGGRDRARGLGDTSPNVLCICNSSSLDHACISIRRRIDYITYLFDSLHFPFFFLPVFLLLFPSLVNPSNKPLNISLVSESILMVLSRRYVVCYINFAVL